MHKTLLALLLITVTSIAQATKEGDNVPACPTALSSSQTQLDFSAYKGKVVLIDFWATWCPPCKKSMPFLNQLRNEKLQNGFEIVAINVDEDSEEAKQYLSGNPVDYPMFFDPNGQCPSIFDVKVMPSSYLIDKAGNVRKVYMGFRDEDQAIIREDVSALLAK